MMAAASGPEEKNAERRKRVSSIDVGREGEMGHQQFVM